MKLRLFVRTDFPDVSMTAGVSSVETELLTHGYLMVRDGDDILGILTPEGVVEKGHRLVMDCMRDVPPLTVEQCAWEALGIMQHGDFRAMPVFHDHRFAGVVTRTDLESASSDFQAELEQRVADRTEELIRINEDLEKNITERRQAEEALELSEQKYRNIFENVAEGIFQTTLDGRFLTVNPSLAMMSGYNSPEEMIESIADIGQQFYVNPEERERLVTILAENDIVEGFEFQVYRKDKSKFLISLNVRVVRDSDGKNLYIEGTCINITDRKLADNKIKGLLAEKKLLLQEVHHRIKNNMNVIMSLLSLQSSMLKDSPAIACLMDARNRVQSMMVLYDKLYRSGDFRAISAKKYLTSLIGEIVGNFPNRGLVTIKKEINDAILDAKTLSPVGIILNELLTNAMKHAFSGREDGLIRVSFSVKENHAMLIIQDNGLGIPESIDITTSTGFGMQLVEMLTEQLQGTIRLERQNGSTFTLEFEV